MPLSGPGNAEGRIHRKLQYAMTPVATLIHHGSAAMTSISPSFFLRPGTLPPEYVSFWCRLVCYLDRRHISLPNHYILKNNFNELFRLKCRDSVAYTLKTSLELGMKA